jgi:hypothetical protein
MNGGSTPPPGAPISWAVVVGSIVALATVSTAVVTLPKVLHRHQPIPAAVVVPTSSPAPSAVPPSPSPPPSSPLPVAVSIPLRHGCPGTTITATAKADRTVVAPRSTVKLTTVLINHGPPDCTLGMSDVAIHVGNDPVPEGVVLAPAVLTAGATVVWSTAWTINRCTRTQCQPAPPGPYTIQLIWDDGLASASVVLRVLNVSPAPQPSYPPAQQ